MPEAFAKEFYEVGNRPGHYHGFLSLLAHERLRPLPAGVPGDQGAGIARLWRGGLGAAESGKRTRCSFRRGMETVRNGDDFLPLDQPEELQRLIVGFRRQLMR